MKLYVQLVTEYNNIGVEMQNVKLKFELVLVTW